MNFAGGGVADTRRRFHDASAAGVTTRVPLESSVPGRRPTRGSGDDALADITLPPVGVGVWLPEDDDVPDEQAASAKVARARTVACEFFMISVPVVRDTFSACVRFPCPDPRTHPKQTCRSHHPA